MLKIKKLNYSIGNKKILNNINCEIKKHKITGIIGKNGSGKTTLIRHLSRELESKNNIFIDDTEINNMSLNNFSKQVSFVFQDYEKIGNFTVRDIIKMGRYPYKKLFMDYSDKDEEKVDDLIELFNLQKIQNSRINVLSGGELKLTFIARALAQETEIIVLDEPINHLDIDYQLKLMNLIKNLKNKTIIMTVHNLDLALKFCDEIIMIDNGEIFDFGNTRDVMTEDNIEKVFKVKCKIKDIDGDKIIIYI